MREVTTSVTSRPSEFHQTETTALFLGAMSTDSRKTRTLKHRPPATHWNHPQFFKIEVVCPQNMRFSCRIPTEKLREPLIIRYLKKLHRAQKTPFLICAIPEKNGMLQESAFPYLLVSWTNKAGDTCFPSSGNFASETGSAPALFVCPRPSCFPFQNLYRPWKRALEVLGASGSALAGVTLKPVWRSDLLDPLAPGPAAVSSLEDPQGHLGCDAHPAKSRQTRFEEIISCADRVIKNAPAIQQDASLSTHEGVRNGLSSPAVNTKSEPGISSWVDQSDAQVRTEQSFDITSPEAQAAYFGALCELDLMAPRPVWMGDILNLPASGRVLAPTPHDHQCPPQHGAECKKSAKSQPEEINFGEVLFIKSATEKFNPARRSPKKSPDTPTENPRLDVTWIGLSQWLGTLSATKNSLASSVWVMTWENNSTPKWLPKATDSTPKVVRSWVSLPPKNSKLQLGIGSPVDQSDARTCVEQTFDFALIDAPPAQFGVIDGLDAMASETNSQRHFRECRADFESTTPLPSGLTRSDSASISPAIYRSMDPGSAQSATQNADGCPPNPPLGRSDSLTNHLPLGHPDEVPRANFLANATTISAQSRAKAGCPAHLRQTQTPNKTTPNKTTP